LVVVVVVVVDFFVLVVVVVVVDFVLYDVNQFFAGWDLLLAFNSIRNIAHDPHLQVVALLVDATALRFTAVHVLVDLRLVCLIRHW
jgi:hypothetical protein